MLAGVPEFVRMKLMRHSDLKLTQGTYTDSGQAPVWKAIESLPTMNDTEIYTDKLVVGSSTVSVRAHWLRRYRDC